MDTTLKQQDGQVHQVWKQDLRAFWKRKRELEELHGTGDIQLGFSIPTVLYPEFKTRWNLDLLRLNKDDRDRLWRIIQTEYPDLIYARPRNRIFMGSAR